MNIVKGIVTGFNSQSGTAQITTYEGDILEDVAFPVSRYDTATGAFSGTPPSIGAPCLCSAGNYENFIINMYPPVNVEEGAHTDKISMYNDHASRTSTAMEGKELLPGQSFSKNATGGEESFDDNCKKIILSPGKLSTVWNTMNNTYDTVCTQYNIRSSGLDVQSEADEGDAANTSIRFKRSMGESPGCVEINVGSEADVITVSICGKELLHIDEERNVTLTLKNLDIIASDNVNISAKEVNMQNVSKVVLP